MNGKSIDITQSSGKNTFGSSNLDLDSRKFATTHAPNPDIHNSRARDRAFDL